TRVKTVPFVVGPDDGEATWFLGTRMTSRNWSATTATTPTIPIDSASVLSRGLWRRNNACSATATGSASAYCTMTSNLVQPADEADRKSKPSEPQHQAMAANPSSVTAGPATAS